MVKLYSGDVFNTPKLVELSNKLVEVLNELGFIISDFKRGGVIKTASQITDIDNAFDELIEVFGDRRNELDGNTILGFANEEKFF